MQQRGIPFRRGASTDSGKLGLQSGDEPAEPIAAYAEMHQKARSAGTRTVVRLINVRRSYPDAGGCHRASDRRADDFVEARAFFEQAVARDPRFATAMAYLAIAAVAEVVLGRSGAREKMVSAALANARRAVELDARDPAAQAALAAAYIVAGDPKSGLDASQRATILNPSMPEAWIWLGWAQLVAGDPETAIASSERGRRLNPQQVMVWFYDTVASAYWELGRYDEGLEAAQRLVAIQPAYCTGYAYIAMNAVALGKIDEARAAIATGRRINPDLSIDLMQGYFAVSRPGVDARRNDALRRAGLE